DPRLRALRQPEHAALPPRAEELRPDLDGHRVQPRAAGQPDGHRPAAHRGHADRRRHREVPSARHVRDPHRRVLQPREGPRSPVRGGQAARRPERRGLGRGGRGPDEARRSQEARRGARHQRPGGVLRAAEGPGPRGALPALRRLLPALAHVAHRGQGGLPHGDRRGDGLRQGGREHPPRRDPAGAPRAARGRGRRRGPHGGAAGPARRPGAAPGDGRGEPQARRAAVHAAERRDDGPRAGGAGGAGWDGGGARGSGARRPGAGALGPAHAGAGRGRGGVEMCGIAGYYSFDGAASPEALTAMLDAIVHRGPDDRGTFAEGPVVMGMNRLAIIDLAGGRQPMTNEDGSVSLVFNGEVYDYRETAEALRRAGHRLRTESDTEVVAHLYEDHGDGCVHRLRGMFAFALWDGPRRRLLLARDRLGIKPLYYAQTRDGLVFASEIKALLRHPDVRAELDPEALGLYLSLKYVPAPLTLFAGIRSLPPAHTLVCDEDGVRVERYWDLRFADAPEPGPDGRLESAEEAADRLDAL